MALNQLDGHPLPCGRLVEDVFDDVEAGRTDAHGRTCAHCITAGRSLVALQDATRELIEDPAEPPAGLLDRIMAAVRAESRRSERLPLEPTDLGPIDVSEQAVAAVVRYAADTVDGVRARSCRVAADGADPAALTITLSVSLRYGTGSAVELLAVVRAHIAAAVEGQVGVRTAGIDIRVVDVWSAAEESA